MSNKRVWIVGRERDAYSLLIFYLRRLQACKGDSRRKVGEGRKGKEELGAGPFKMDSATEEKGERVSLSGKEIREATPACGRKGLTKEKAEGGRRMWFDSTRRNL